MAFPALEDWLNQLIAQYSRAMGQLMPGFVMKFCLLAAAVIPHLIFSWILAAFCQGILETVLSHQYVCRLMGYYTEHGVPMCAGAQGFYAAGIPPSLQTATVIISLLLQVEQGVKHLSVKCAGHGNLVQDVVSSKVRCNLFQEYLDKLGYRDIEMFPVLVLI